MHEFDNKIKELAIEAIKKTKEQIDYRYADETLFGYALCTDDDVSGVYHVCCTEAWVKKKSKTDEDIGFISVEWEQSGNDSFLDMLNEVISADYENSKNNFGKHRDKRFESLVLALIEVRKLGIFEELTHLSVGSTDPSDYLEFLEMRGIDRTNPKVIADRLAEALLFEEYRKNINCE